MSLDIFCPANREEHYEDNRLERLTSISTYRLDIGSRVPLTSDQLRGKEIVRHGLYIRRRSDLSDRFWKVLKNHASGEIRIPLLDLLNLMP